MSVPALPPDGVRLWGPGEGGDVSPGTVLKAGLDDGQGRLTLMERISPLEIGSPPHIHHHMDEAWYVLEGELTYQSGEWSGRAGPGTFVFVRSGTPHRYTVTSAGPARFLELFTDGGMEGFFASPGRCRSPMAIRFRPTRRLTPCGASTT